ncbi:MAG: hypothetical protein QOJ15_11060 [Bradyrhizobium sp.]|jgi:hypothetical protein|nr:hypothetical protein [Bradyrhizobium sp.]
MNVRYRVELSHAERDELTAMLSKGKRAARKLKRAQILLAADAGRSDEEIARAVAVGGSTVYRTKRRFVESSTPSRCAGVVATACTQGKRTQHGRPQGVGRMTNRMPVRDRPGALGWRRGSQYH